MAQSLEHQNEKHTDRDMSINAKCDKIAIQQVRFVMWYHSDSITYSDRSVEVVLKQFDHQNWGFAASVMAVNEIIDALLNPMARKG